MINLPGKGAIIFLIVAFVAIVLIAYGVGRSSVSTFTTTTRLHPASYVVNNRTIGEAKILVDHDTTFTYQIP